MSEDGREWRPIETAPRDGTTVLLWLRERQQAGGRMTDMPCVDDYRVGLFVRHSRTLPNGGWRYLNNAYAYAQDENFTHWMPLPEPPKP